MRARGRRQPLVRTLAVAALAAIPLSVRPAEAVSPRALNACAGAGMPTNAVVRFYYALNQRQFAAAYGCLAPSVQARLPFATFAAGYATTVSNRLWLADSEVPNGDPVDHVTIDLHAVDRVNGRLVAKTFKGQWHLDTLGRLARASIRLTAQRVVTVIPPTDVKGVFAYRGEEILAEQRADVTGDGVRDNIYVTSGSGCASCHAQRIWVYSLGRLVFQQQVDDAVIVAGRDQVSMTITTDTPGSPGLDSACPSERTVERWGWTPYGFAWRGQRTVHRTC